MIQDKNIIREIKLKWKLLPLGVLAGISDEDADSPVTSYIPKFVVDHCRKLLAIAGHEVCVACDDIEREDIALKAGELINHKGIIRVQGQMHRCHKNCAEAWRKAPKLFRLTTGYALGLDDNIWVSHSWLQTPDDMIVETTSPFDLYYGVILDEVESEEFCKLVLKEN